MKIKEIKYLIGEWGRVAFGPICAGLITISSFGLGMLESYYFLKQKTEFSNNLVVKDDRYVIYRDRCEDGGYGFVASQNGTKYYPIDCSYVSRIKEENKIFFRSEGEAIKGGYERSSQCK